MSQTATQAIHVPWSNSIWELSAGLRSLESATQAWAVRGLVSGGYLLEGATVEEARALVFAGKHPGDASGWYAEHPRHERKQETVAAYERFERAYRDPSEPTAKQDGFWDK